MDRRIKILILSFFVFSLLPFQQCGIGDLQFIALGFFSFSTVLISFYINSNEEIVKKSDCLWLFFIFWSFITFFWSINVSLVWYPSFGWFIYFALAISIRYLSKNFDVYPLISKTFSYSFFILLTSLSLVFLVKGLPHQYDSSALYTRNYNYLGCLLSVLFPFVAFNNSSERLPILLRCITVVIYSFILYVLTVKGVFIASIIPSFLWIGFQFKNYRRFFIFSFIFSLLAIILVALLVSMSAVLDNLLGIGASTRAHLLKASYKMFTENPLGGVGTGNWFINIYKYPFDDVNFFSNGYYWIRYYSHNLYSLILSEMGILAFLSFLAYWGNLLYKSKISFKEYAPAYISIVTYLILSCFYNACNFLPFQFNGVQFISFVCAGILMSTLPADSYVLSKWYSFSILSLLVVSICWFGYMAVINNYYHKATNLKKHNQEEALSILEDLYYPNLFTSRKHNHNLPFEIARLHLEMSNNNQADRFFRESLKYSPFDGKYHAAYGNFLNSSGNVGSAKFHYLKSISYQKNRYSVNFSLGKIYFDEEKRDSALIYLSRLKGSSYDYKSSILIEKLKRDE